MICFHLRIKCKAALFFPNMSSWLPFSKIFYAWCAFDTSFAREERVESKFMTSVDREKSKYFDPPLASCFSHTSTPLLCVLLRATNSVQLPTASLSLCFSPLFFFLHLFSSVLLTKNSSVPVLASEMCFPQFSCKLGKELKFIFLCFYFLCSSL